MRNFRKWLAFQITVRAFRQKMEEISSKVAALSFGLRLGSNEIKDRRFGMIELLKRLYYYGGIMTFGTLSPRQKKLHYSCRLFVLTCATFFSVSSILDILINVRTLEDLAENCNLSITGCLIYLKTLHIIYNGDLLKEIIIELEKVRLCKYCKNLFRQFFFIRILLTEVSACFILWNVVFINKNPPFRLWLPYDLRKNNTIYWLTMITLIIIFMIMSFLLIIIGSSIGLILIYFLRSVLDVKHNILSMGQYLNDPTQIENIKSQLKKCIMRNNQLYE